MHSVFKVLVSMGNMRTLPVWPNHDIFEIIAVVRHASWRMLSLYIECILYHTNQSYGK